MSRLLKTIRAADGETLQVTNQWAAEADKRGTTVTGSTWTYSGAGTLAGESLSGSVASVKLTPTSKGRLENTVTLANGETLVALRCVAMECPRPLDYQV